MIRTPALRCDFHLFFFFRENRMEKSDKIAGYSRGKEQVEIKLRFNYVSF